MKGIRILLCLAGAALLVVAASQVAADGGVSVDSNVPGGFNGNLEYSGGPNACGQCHLKAFEDWLGHGHSRKLALAFELRESANNTSVGDRGHTTHARSQGFPIPAHDPDVYNWDNVLMIIGASKHWKTRYVGLDGYILTKNGQNQYNWATGEWTNYHTDELKPFSCGTCHTTGYRPEGTAFQPDFPGIVGDFSHINITCEACHGPGAAHAAAPSSSNIEIDLSAAACGRCHTRGSDDTVALASGGFIRHHEQYPEQLNGPHWFLRCTDCHDAHVGRYQGVTTACETCHPAEALEYAGSSMDAEGVTCVDCHMAKATKSALKHGPFEGDVWTHLFRINSNADYDMFNRDADGNTVSARNAINLEFACFRCHADADKAAFADIGPNGTAYHTLGK